MSKRSNVNNIKDNVKSVVIEDLYPVDHLIDMSNVADVMAVDIDDLPRDSGRMRGTLESEREMEMVVPISMHKRSTMPPSLHSGPGGPKLLQKESRKLMRIIKPQQVNATQVPNRSMINNAAESQLRSTMISSTGGRQ